MKRIVNLTLIGIVASAGTAGAQDTTADSLAGVDIPVGHGTLSQDAITLRLTSGSLEIRFLPLDERVTRLLAPDGYQALKALQASKQAAIDSIAQDRGITRPGIALVSFHALAPTTRFDPHLLTVGLHGQQYRAIGFVPLSAAFSNQQLDVRDLATGLFVFERPLPVHDAFTVSYLSATTEDWERRLERLDTERARILTRGRARTDSLVR